MSIMRINIGPMHPSTHGLLRLIVDVDGDKIENIEPRIGFLHRGVEKLLENRMYMQSPPFLEKIDYVAPMGWDELFVASIEQATQTQVKEAAQYIRMILLEFQRIASHLLWIGTFLNDLGQMFTIFMWAFRERAEVLKLLEDISGSRMFYVNFRLGGLTRQIPEDFVERAFKLTDYLEAKVTQYKDIIDDSSIFIQRTKRIGVLPKDIAIAYGVSGPVLRASGIHEDVRKSKPYYAYDKINFKIPIRINGDSLDRYKVRYEEIFQSIYIIRKCLDYYNGLSNKDVTGLPIKLIGPPAKPDIVITQRELPRGEGLIYMIPAPQKPYRVALRSPAFSNLAALPKLATGSKFADLFSILGSLDIVMPEIDK
ncbi:MAG: NADH-quinone oxidoreductase subunit D [Candidatus Micrarchaeaceae archaeon]